MPEVDEFSEWEKVVPVVTRDYAYVSASSNVTSKGRHLRISVVAELISQLNWTKVGMVQCFTKFDTERNQRILAFVPAQPSDADSKAMCFPLQEAIKGSRKIILQDLPFVPLEKIARLTCAHRREDVAKRHLIVELPRDFNTQAKTETGADKAAPELQAVARKTTTANVASAVQPDAGAPTTEKYSRVSVVTNLLKKVRLLHANPSVNAGKLQVSNGRHVKMPALWCEVLDKMITQQESGKLYGSDEFLDMLVSCGVAQAREASTVDWLDKLNTKFLTQVKLKTVLDTGFVYLTHE